MTDPPSPMLLRQQLLSDELITEVLSWLPAKTLTRLKCVSKTWNTLIASDSNLIKLHHRRSAAQNPQLLFQWDHIYNHNRSLTPFPVSRLVENSLTTLPDDPCHRIGIDGITSCWLVGSSNGLICINYYSFNIGYREDWLCFWNPATRFISQNLGYFRSRTHFSKFTFGYDNSTDTYKVVRFDMGNGKRKFIKGSQEIPVKVFTLADNLWRDIQSLPLDVAILHNSFHKPNDGVNLVGTLNWIALYNNPSRFYDPKVVTVDQFLILSLDLRTETYTQFSLPKGFDEVPSVEPSIGDLMDCLCFCHVWQKTHFVIWQMKEFGVENSWTQFLKISYQDLEIQLFDFSHQYPLFPLFLYNGNTLILTDSDGDRAILFDMRDNIAERTRITNNIYWSTTVTYVESLVSPY